MSELDQQLTPKVICQFIKDFEQENDDYWEFNQVDDYRVRRRVYRIRLMVDTDCQISF